MARALLFSDGFDVYDTLTKKWDSQSANDLIDLTGTLSRSGLGCMVINTGGGGTQKNFTAGSQFIVSGAQNTTGLGGGGVFGPALQFADTIAGKAQVGLQTLEDGGVAVTNNSLVSSFLVRSAAGIIRPSVYNVLTLMVDVAAGRCKVWANGVKVIDATGLNLNPAATGIVNQITLRSLGGGTVCYWDDVTLWSYTDYAADEFPFMPSVLPWMPVSDSAPLKWTPKTNGSPHFAMVNAVPASVTNYNFDATPGDIDQYVHQIPANQIKPPLGNQVQVLGILHHLYAALDAAGARTIASNKGGVPTGAFSLSTTVQYYLQPYTPGIAAIQDMNTTPFGPEVTA